MAEETLFDLPSSPDAFGVVLAPANLRNFEFSALDYTSGRRSIIEYIQTYYPDDFNDFVASNGIIMIMEIVSAVMAKLAVRSDVLAQEGTFATAQTEEAIANIIPLINQRIRRQTSAVVDIEISLSQSSLTDIEIQPGTSFTVPGIDSRPITYEVFKAPNDFVNTIVIPASKRGVIAYGIEGAFASQVLFNSNGGPNQQYVINEPTMLEYPIFVQVRSGSTVENWLAVFDPIERYNSTDKVVEVAFLGDNVIFNFGDNVNGAAPLAGQQVLIRYRKGGGIRGRIGVGQIDTVRSISPLPPVTAVAPVRFRNITASLGGTDKESLKAVKRRAPRDSALHSSIVTDVDYAQAASSYSHPVYGTISKAVATIRTGYNANLVEIYALAVGSSSPVAPSIGLKQGLSTYFSNLNVLTDHISVLDGIIKPVDIEMTVVIGKNSDASVIKGKVEQAITDFFDISDWEMGQPFFLSNFIESIESIDGISYIDVLQPTNNIVATRQLYDAAGTDSAVGVSINELIVEGQRNISYYYERSR